MGCLLISARIVYIQSCPVLRVPFGLQYTTVHEAELVPLGSELVRVRGTAEVWAFFGDLRTLPANWPFRTVTRAWYNPLRYLFGHAYKDPVRGWAEYDRRSIDVIVPSRLITAIPV